MKAVGYCRISRGEQSKYSLEAQRNLVTSYAQKNGIELVGFVEDKKSGLDFEERPGLQEILQYIHKKKADLILFSEWDRLSRDPELTGYLKFEAKMNSVELRSISEEKKEKNEYDELVDGIISIVSKFETKRRMMRIKRAKTIAYEKRKVMHPIPFGYKKGLEYPEPDEEKAQLVKEMFEDRADGMSFPQIATKYALGSATKAYRILRNPFYAGQLRFNGKILDGKHKPLITKEEWESAQKATRTE